LIEFRGIHHAFGARPVLENIDLSVGQSEFVCIVGPSGCGKTTLLRLLAGLLTPNSGEVTLGGKRVTAPPPEVAFMFQDYSKALLPWRTASGNVSLALEAGDYPRANRATRISELLEKVGLGGHAEAYPAQLSGGMRQRTALARALAQDSQVLLMDEPFGALDAMTRDVLHDELESLWRTTGKTVMFVTHNVREAIRLGDRVVLLTSRPGRVAQITPVAIERPRRIDSPEIATLAASITDRLRDEMERHARGK